MVTRRSRIILITLLSCITHSALLPIKGSAIRQWFTKDRNLFLISLSAAVCHEYFRGKYNGSWLRSLVTQKDITKADALYLNQLGMTRRDCIATPNTISQLEHYDFFHVRSPDQVGPSCAWYSALNAKAIQDIISKHENLTASNISHHVCKQLVPLVEKQGASIKKLLGVLSIFDGLRVHQVTKLVSHLGVQNYYSVWLHNDEDDGGRVFVSSDTPEKSFVQKGSQKLVYQNFCTKYEIPDLSKLAAAIKKNKAPVVQIVLTVPSSHHTLHSVLLTIVNRPEKKPLLLYLNSNGNNLHHQLFDASGNTENAYISRFIKTLDCA